MSEFIVYGLIDPDTFDIRYIGKSITGLKRANEHRKPASLKNDGNTPKANWIRKLKNNGKDYFTTILYNLGNCQFDKTTINDILYKKEQELINYYNILGYNLTNRQDGGPGSPGRILSEESKKKMSLSAKKREMPKALKDNQKSKYNDPEGKRICSKCEETKELDSFGKYKEKFYRVCRSCFNKNRPKRRVKDPYKSTKIPVIAKNEKEIIKFNGLKEAARLIGGKCNKTGINLAIKNNRSYYGYFWSLI